MFHACQCLLHNHRDHVNVCFTIIMVIQTGDKTRFNRCFIVEEEGTHLLKNKYNPIFRVVFDVGRDDYTTIV